jgi:hypothetical protein
LVPGGPDRKPPPLVHFDANDPKRPGADMFHGRIDNTRVFRIMATALGLGAK